MNEKKILNEDNLEEVDGGAALADYTDEEYNAAGIEVIGPGEWHNQGYRLKASGENLSSRQAYYCVSFYRAKGRPAQNWQEVYDRYKRVFEQWGYEF